MNEEARKRLEIYLRDHYAGAISALELLDHLAAQHQEDQLGSFFRDLRIQIGHDHEQLHNIMEALGFKESSIRDAGAWIAEKFTRLKVGFTAAEGADLRLLQSLEVLLIGVTGKKHLWLELDVGKSGEPVLEQTDFARLIERAEEQLQGIEERRLEAARSAFGAG